MPRTTSRLLLTLLLPTVALLAAACGSADEESAPPATADTSAQTAYGSVGDVSDYLKTINPLIQRSSLLLQDFQTALGSAQDGATNRIGTGRNLAAKAQEVRPGFVEVRDALDAVEPPPLLAPFQRDFRKMLASRLEALDRVIEGWEVEQAGGDFEAVYREAQARHNALNQQLQQLNTQMNRINQSVEAALAAGN